MCLVRFRAFWAVSFWSFLFLFSYFHKEEDFNIIIETEEEQGEFHVGEMVEVEYQQGNVKWWKAKIVKDYKDGTYEIRYEPGGEEDYVKKTPRNRIRKIQTKKRKASSSSSSSSSSSHSVYKKVSKQVQISEDEDEDDDGDVDFTPSDDYSSQTNDIFSSEQDEVVVEEETCSKNNNKNNH